MIYLVIFLGLLNVITIFYCIKFGLIILGVQDVIEEALDVIDEKYESITEICERPLFYDSPEVRKVLDDIKATRTALHKIAFSLCQDFETLNDSEEEESN